MREGETKCRHPVPITISLPFSTHDILKNDYLIISLLRVLPTCSPFSSVPPLQRTDFTRHLLLDHVTCYASSNKVHCPFYFSACAGVTRHQPI